MAFDPRLRRSVAVKVLHDPAPDGVVRSDARLIEARALARLRHDNVVTVFDSGVARLEPSSLRVAFVVMELIEGVPLRQWLEGEPSLRRIVAVLTRSAEGLGAAHRTGVIHCDVKPSNILVGARDRVKVIDFGIAWELSDPSVEDGGAPAAGEGTRRYMAPEQYAGGRITAAVDQYGLATTFIEAMEPQTRDDASNPEMAEELCAVLERARRSDPRDRYPSMRDLGREVRRIARPLRRGRTWWGVGAAASLVVGLGVFSASEPVCGSVQGDVSASVQRLRSPGGSPVAAKVGDRLAEQAYALQMGFAEACNSGAQRQAMLACLDVAQGELRSAAELLERADLSDDAIEELLGGLQDVAGCGEVTQTPQADRVAFERSLAAAAVAVAAGETREVDGRLTELLETSLSENWLDAADRVRVLRGQALYEGANFEVAGREFEAAYFGGLRRGDHLVAARAGRGLVEVETARGELHAARRWGDHAESQLESAGVGETQRRFELTQARGVVDLFLGDFETARVRLESSVAGLGRGEDRRANSAVARMHLALAELELGQYERAIGRLEQLVEERAASGGRLHLDVAATLQNLANAYLLAKRWDDAVATIEEADAIIATVRGEEDIGRSVLQVMHADAEISRGNPARGLELIGPARSRLQRDLPAGHVARGIADLVLARSESKLGEVDAALDHAASARAHYESAFGADHPRMGEAFYVLAEIYDEAGREEDAREAAGRALSIFEATRPADHPWFAEVRKLLPERPSEAD